MRVVVIGGSGRLGQLIVQRCRASNDAVVSVGRSDSLHSLIGDGVDTVVVDVASAGSSAHHAAVCVDLRVPLLVGTTGLSAAEFKALDDASSSIAVLVAANLSPGAHLEACGEHGSFGKDAAV